LQPLLGEDLGRRLQDPLPVQLGVPAQRPRLGTRVEVMPLAYP
jgi:hypothetical protein